MPYVYSKSRSHLYVQVQRVVTSKNIKKTKSKTITVCDYSFALLLADIKEFLDLKYPLRKDIIEKRMNRGRPKTYISVIEVNQTNPKINNNASFSLGDDYEIDDVEQQIRFFLKKRFGQI